MTDPLRGGCACGRNHYLVSIPNNVDLYDRTKLILDTSAHSRRLQASPLTAFLKIPLSWFQSSTIAFRDDENHRSIRRTFTVPQRDHLRHQFCGYCGTQLFLLDSSSRNEDKFISLTLGSMSDKDIERLEELGLFSAPVGSSLPDDIPSVGEGQIFDRDSSWFQEFIEGKTRRKRGAKISSDGSIQVEWEVVEYNNEQGEVNPSKRKLEDVEDIQGTI